jgi:hypothetical protein
MLIQECGTCGLPHVTRAGNQACSAHKRGTNQTEGCRQEPVRGATICHYHGGASPLVRAKAAEQLVRQKAEDELHRFGIAVKVDPAEELLDLIAHTAGYVRYLRTRVDALMAEDQNWGISRMKEGGEDYGPTYEAKPNVWIQMLDHWTEKHARLLVEALKLKLDERRVKLAEAQGNALIRVLDGVLLELGHNPTDVHTAEIVAKHLRLVS